MSIRSAPGLDLHCNRDIFSNWELDDQNGGRVGKDRVPEEEAWVCPRVLLIMQILRAHLVLLSWRYLTQEMKEIWRTNQVWDYAKNGSKSDRSFVKVLEKVTDDKKWNKSTGVSSWIKVAAVIAYRRSIFLRRRFSAAMFWAVISSFSTLASWLLEILTTPTSGIFSSFHWGKVV